MCVLCCSVIMVHKLVNMYSLQSFKSQSLCKTYFYGLRGRQTQGPLRAAHTLATPLQSMHVHGHVLYTACRCNYFEFTIHLMTIGLLNTAVFQYKSQDQRTSKTCRSISYSVVHEISKGGPFFTFSLPGGRRAPLLTALQKYLK